MSYKQINSENSPFSVIDGTFLIQSAGGSGMTFYGYLTEREYTIVLMMIIVMSMV